MARIEYKVKQIGIGTPDYSPVKPPGQIIPGPIYTLADMGELAARLGSIDTFDRRGNVIWFDDFESGIEKWTHESAAGGEDLVWSSLHARNGGFSAKLTTGAHTGDDALMMASLAYPRLSKIGFEISFLRDSYLREIIIRMGVETGTEIIIATATWVAATKVCSCIDKDGVTHDLTPTITFGLDYPILNTIKLVADFINKEYVRLIVNSIEFNLSGITLPVIPVGPSPKLHGYLKIFTVSDDVCTLYVNDAIFTQNEP